MKDKELKRKLIIDGKLKPYKDKRNDIIKTYGYDKLPIYIDTNDKENKALEQLRRANYEQSKKVEHHINFLFNQFQYIYFATFTFDNRALSLTAYTRKQAVRRLLSDYFDDFILNIDFGSENEREHYHAIICSNINNEYIENKHLKHSKLDTYDLGFYSIEKVKIDDLDALRISKYTSKLTLHSIKVKQSYISVKKGSLYQQYQAIKRELKRLRKYNQFDDIIYKNIQRLEAKLYQVEHLGYLIE